MNDLRYSLTRDHLSILRTAGARKVPVLTLRNAIALSLVRLRRRVLATPRRARAELKARQILGLRNAVQCVAHLHGRTIAKAKPLLANIDLLFRARAQS